MQCNMVYVKLTQRCVVESCMSGKECSLDGDGVCLFVSLDSDLKLITSLKCFAVRQTNETHLVQGIAAIADQFSDEHFPVAVKTVDNHVHQPVDLKRQANTARILCGVGGPQTRLSQQHCTSAWYSCVSSLTSVAAALLTDSAWRARLLRTLPKALSRTGVPVRKTDRLAVAFLLMLRECRPFAADADALTACTGRAVEACIRTSACKQLEHVRAVTQAAVQACTYHCGDCTHRRDRQSQHELENDSIAYHALVSDDAFSDHSVQKVNPGGNPFKASRMFRSYPHSQRSSGLLCSVASHRISSVQLSRQHGAARVDAFGQTLRALEPGASG